MSLSKSRSISYSGTTKTATCAITVTVENGAVVKSSSSVKCTIPWPKAKALSKSSSIWVVVGDVNTGLLNVKVGFKLVKKAGNAASTTKTNNPSFTPQDYSSDTPATYPADLWCPQEDTIVYTEAGNFVHEVRRYNFDQH